MKAKKLLCSVPLLLATTFISQAALAAVVDIQPIRLSKIDSPLEYKDARATQLAINNVVSNVREAAAKYFFKNVQGNFDKFELFATTEFPSRRIMNLNLNLKMKPGFTLKNGDTELTKRFRINLFNKGECVMLDTNTRLWRKVPNITTDSTCNARNDPANYRYYTWIYAPLENSDKGICEEYTPHLATWHLTKQTRGLDKFECERKIADSPEYFRWYSSFPELSAHSELRGYSIDIREHMPQVPRIIQDVMTSVNIPEGYIIRFYTQENFQGDYYTRWPGTYNHEHLSQIKSIKVIESPLNPEVPPPSKPTTVSFSVRNTGAYDGKVVITYQAPDGQPYKDVDDVLGSGHTYRINIPYESTDVRFEVLRWTGIAWEGARRIFEKQVSPALNNHCFSVNGTTLHPGWREVACP